MLKFPNSFPLAESILLFPLSRATARPHPASSPSYFRSKSLPRFGHGFPNSCIKSCENFGVRGGAIAKKSATGGKSDAEARPVFFFNTLRNSNLSCRILGIQRRKIQE